MKIFGITGWVGWNRWITAIVAIAVLGIAPSHAQQAATAADLAQAIAKADAAMSAALDRGLPGLSVAVGIDGEVLWAKGYGFANVELHAPVTPETKFRVGSVAKSITSIALGKLIDRGKLDIDQPVQTYLPEFPAKPEGVITSRLVAGHLAGIRHYLPDGSDNLIAKHYDDVIVALELFKDDPLLHAPGTKYQYSSYGWNLLSAVIQRASGTPFLQFMEAEVWTPLHMTDTCPDEIRDIIDDRATPYVRHNLPKPKGAGKNDPTPFELRNAPYADNSYKWAGGGFLSTTPDLIRFGAVILDDSILKDDTIELLLTSQKDGEGKDTGYGMGWNVRTVKHERWASHTGGSVGGTTAFAVNRETGLTIAMVSNLSGAPLGMRDVWDIAEAFDVVDGE